MKLQLRLNGMSWPISLDPNATALDLMTLLPLRLSLEDYAATEKISALPRRLTTEGAPSGYAPMAGDVTYYAPWGNLALFHKSFRHSAGLVRLGRLDGGIEALAVPGRFMAELRLSID